MKMVFVVLLLALSFVFAPFAEAQNTSRSVFGYFGLGLATTSVKSHPAQEQGVGRGWNGFVDVGARFRNLGIDLSAGWGRFEDKRKFEEVAGSFIAGYKARRSYVDMVPFSVSAGMFTSRLYLDKSDGKWLNIGANIGNQWLHVKRHIPWCSDCRKDKIILRGGLYFEPMLMLEFTAYGQRPAGLAFSFRKHLRKSDLNNRLAVFLFFSF